MSGLMYAYDFTRAARRASERKALVEAVLAGGAAAIETDFIEWKSTFNLEEKRFRAAASKHILGFANRIPERAGRNAEGYGYLLIGVEPLNLVGVADVWDPERLESWLTPYTGPDLRWDAAYVELHSKHVLFITVDPPRPGDPIWPFCREAEDEAGNTIRNGVIYVRRPGKTEPANSADVARLTDRARAGAQMLSLEVEVMSGPVRALPTSCPAHGLAEHPDRVI